MLTEVDQKMVTANQAHEKMLEILRLVEYTWDLVNLLVKVVEVRYGSRREQFHPDETFTGNIPPAGSQRSPPRPESWGMTSRVFRLSEDMEDMWSTVKYPLNRVESVLQIFVDKNIHMLELEEIIAALARQAPGMSNRARSCIPYIDRLEDLLEQNASLLDDVNAQLGALEARYEVQKVREDLAALKGRLNGDEMQEQLIAAHEVGEWLRSHPDIFNRTNRPNRRNRRIRNRRSDTNNPGA